MDLEKIAREHVEKVENMASIGMATLHKLLIGKGVINADEFENAYKEIENFVIVATLESLMKKETTDVLNLLK